ncbi:MAG TPA: hypothetical protein VFE36_04275 [Candidatus Baltobacteraceae bacterium]|jgi:hypothetical protein|nr:hypothetical protein [Candidatus Baltobacteraceae bacterium]
MFLRSQLGRLSAAASILLCAALAGCALRGATPSGATPEIPSSRGSAPVTHLYVWNSSVPPAELDEVPTTGGRPVLRITSPKGLSAGRTTIDGNGTLYIDGGPPYAPNISEYKAGSTKPFKKIVKGVGVVIGLTTDSKNDLYVLDASGPLVKYAPGATKPAFATYSGLCAATYAGPISLTADRSGNVYVLTRCGKAGSRQHGVLSQYGGGTKVKRTISFAPSRVPLGLTVDASGRLYVTFADETAEFRVGIAEYDPGASKPATSFYVSPPTTPNSGGGAPVVDDSTGVLYQTFNTCVVTAGPTTQCTSSISIYPRGATKPSHRLKGPSNAMLGTPALDDAGNLYVEADSPNSATRTIYRYAQNTWTKTAVLSERKTFLGFAWPTVASSRTSFGGPVLFWIGGH